MSEYKDGHGDRYLAAGRFEDMARLAYERAVETEEARDYAASLLDRIWSLGQELERVRTALHSGGLDVERLALAIAEDDDFSLGSSKMYEPEAARIAAEYARLPAEARA